MKRLFTLLILILPFVIAACDESKSTDSDTGPREQNTDDTEENNNTDSQNDSDTETDTEEDSEENPFGTDPVDRSDAFDMVDSFGPCVNLGNWLEAPNQDWGVKCDKTDIDRIAEMGFTTIRIPTRWESRSSNEAPYTIDADFFEVTDNVLDWCEAAGVNAVINMHHHDAFFEDPEGNKARFLAMWRQIAERYKDRPASVVFEIMNEPNTALTPELWNEFLVDALVVIRKTNPKRFVVIGTAEWGGLGAVDKLILPNDPNIIFTFHYYDPREFTHQGADWAEGSDAWLGTTWTGTALEKLAVKNAMSAAEGWAELNDIPVWMGEFGSFEEADDDSRARWTEHTARFAEDAGFAWCYWDYKAGFALWDETEKSWNTFLTDALFNDDFSITQINLDELGENLLENGDFENGTEGWSENFNGGDAVSEVKDGVLVVTVNETSDNSWEIQYKGDLPPLTEGTSYAVLFDMWTDAPRSVYVGVQRMADPWPIHGDSTVRVTTVPITQVLNVTATMDDDLAAFVINLGDTVGTVYIDNVRFIEQ